MIWFITTWLALIALVFMFFFYRHRDNKLVREDGTPAPGFIRKDSAVYLLRADVDIYIGKDEKGKPQIIRAGTCLPSNHEAIPGREYMFTKVKR